MIWALLPHFSSPVATFDISSPVATFAPGFARMAGSCHARARGISCKAPEFIFQLNEDRSQIQFGCRQKSVTMVRPEDAGSLQEFLSSSSNAIVMSSWDPGKIVDNGDGEYTIAVEEVRHESLNRADDL